MRKRHARRRQSGPGPARLIPTLVLAAVLAAAIPAASALAGQRVALRDDLSVAGPEVRLGDLFDDAGASSGVVVARATGPVLVLDARQIQALAQARGLDWSNPNGFRRLVVQVAQSPTAAPRDEVPSAAPSFQPAAASRPLPAPASLERTADILTWTHNLAAGDLVRPDDVMWAKLPARLSPSDAPRDADAVVGQATRRPLREGAPVAARDVAPPKVIHRDQTVEVIFAVDGVRLVLSGRALADAAAGDTVQVLNTQSKKTIEAIATGPGRAAAGLAPVDPRSDQLAVLSSR
jgi:flagella basal body P-ring formation protein FlgA